MKCISHYIYHICFLAVFDCASRAHEMEICLSSVIVVSGPCRNLSLNLMQFKKTNKYLSFSLTWDPMGAKIQNAPPRTNHSRKFSNVS